ncbi:glycine zipper 2TM domain-containing protein [Rhodoferax sp. U11-2br]|uniref:glycine zipper 2TM domain-containing protein n=1 Tax=Rhodoferax sp. U11-2br TaxID=2838878 RepID=UPI001BEB723F|nr:hypothetical protein [Rhodoferax sp. U11-2br]MBT3068171.1 hypothetical protein [Rhodoferax sp. U11-2br]
MKQQILVAALALVCGTTFAQEVGRVVSSTPVIQQVAVPRQVCSTEQVAVAQPKSGAGAVMGAIAGGAMGNAIGHGSGQAAATMLGLFGGAVLGDRIEGQGDTQLQNVQRCSSQTFYENRTVAYNVVYEYAGKQYSVQMPQDPGPTLQLQVTPVGAAPAAAAPTAQLSYDQVQPTTVIVTQPVYPVYAPRPYYPPVSLNLGWGYWGGNYGHGHGHWR